MAVDLKLVQWIKANRARFSRSELLEKLKVEGHIEQDIIDSYESVVKMGTEGGIKPSKSMVATVILSILFPGTGHMYTGAGGIGALILILWLIGVIFNFTLIGAILGIPLTFAMWLWGLIGSIIRCDKINKGKLFA